MTGSTPPAVPPPTLVPPHLKVRTWSLWRLARATTRKLGSPRATNSGPLSALYRVPASAVAWRTLHHHRNGVVVLNRAHLVTEQLLPPLPRRTTTPTDTLLIVTLSTALVAGALLAFAVNSLPLLLAWYLIGGVFFLVARHEDRVTRSRDTTTPLIARAVTAVSALGHRGVVIRADNFTSTRVGDGRELMHRWRDHLDAHAIAVDVTARTQHLADRYTSFDGFHLVSADDPLLMYRLPTTGPSVGSGPHPAGRQT